MNEGPTWMMSWQLWRMHRLSLRLLAWACGGDIACEEAPLGGAAVPCGGAGAPGLMSRWMMPSVWRYERARSMGRAICGRRGRHFAQ